MCPASQPLTQHFQALTNSCVGQVSHPAVWNSLARHLKLLTLSMLTTVAYYHYIRDIRGAQHNNIANRWFSAAACVATDDILFGRALRSARDAYDAYTWR